MKGYNLSHTIGTTPLEEAANEQQEYDLNKPFIPQHYFNQGSFRKTLKYFSRVMSSQWIR